MRLGAPVRICAGGTRQLVSLPRPVSRKEKSMTGSIAETAKITGKKQAEKNFQTQWLAQFLVAAELTRRGYTVTFSLGNCPVIDLMVRVPGTNASFVVDVKGTSNKYSGWWMSRKEQSLFGVKCFFRSTTIIFPDA